ncbi:zona pellucida glycoprotein 3f, tandem duplicate 2 [Brienomyrus brachyistius]|uniref:zona pellucida glycoprotein 3f, tandem duplicate 2 n=1 Tax=Brienomyrus brachyistius TaxID=42636 RepID=UPI0020B3E36D|nr:zona pellucida glycoprotein 3f, tandem duplicate 2 [Brienomyrus brachyistius]
MIFWVVLLVLTVVAFASGSDEVNVTCDGGSVTLTWTLSASLDAHPSRIFLGNCHPSSYSNHTGRGVATFNVLLKDCRFKRLVTGDHLIYKNRLAYRPLAKPNPPEIFHEVLCVFDRPDNWIPPLFSSSHGAVHGYGGLHFYIGIMNDDFSGPARSASFPVGSQIPIWAAVDQQAHMPLMLFLQECVAATVPEMGTSHQVYPLITNGGCLVDSKESTSKFHRRHRTSEMFLSLQAFDFGVGEDVYIHCKIAVWDPKHLNRQMKACNYVKKLDRWELLDDPSRNSLCSCCNTQCHYRKSRAAELDSQGLIQNAVLGPITIVDVQH